MPGSDGPVFFLIPLEKPGNAQMNCTDRVRVYIGKNRIELQWSRTMPVYEYECSDCDKVFEVQQKISDEPIKICPACQGEVRKLVSMSSFQLKGGGWYADGYGSASTAKTEEKVTKEKPAPACATGGACAGCPAAASS